MTRETDIGGVQVFAGDFVDLDQATFKQLLTDNAIERFCAPPLIGEVRVF
jgi:hypothetical protein